MLSNDKVIAIKERGMDTGLQRLGQVALALRREHDVSMAINHIVENIERKRVEKYGKDIRRLVKSFRVRTVFNDHCSNVIQRLVR